MNKSSEKAVGREGSSPAKIEDPTKTLSYSDDTQTWSLGRAWRDGANDPTFYSGEVVAGRYTIVRPAGHGGMGEVYEAIDQELGQRVALKTLRSDGVESEAIRERFRQEILLARQVTHPNVCRIFDLSYHTPPDAHRGRQPLISMELLTGETLATRLRRDGALEPREVRRIAVQITRGLAAAHREGIVHCDLKSSNVMMVPHDNLSRAVVMDFGLASTSSLEAKHADSPSGSSGSRPGTPGYMAPELLWGNPATPAADIFSLGVVILEMLTGERVERNRVEDREPLQLPLHPAIDAFWGPVLRKCLDLNPKKRFADAAELLELLEFQELHPWRRLLLAAAMGGIMVLTTILIYFGLARDGPRPAMAVLTLKNLDADPAYDWVSSVLPELLSDRLSRDEKIRVTPRETLKQMGLDRTAASEEILGTDYRQGLRAFTGVDYVLAGRYGSAGDSSGELKVELWLYDTVDGSVVRFSRQGAPDDLPPLAAALTDWVFSHLNLPRSAPSSTPNELPPDAARLYAEGLRELDGFRAHLAIKKLRAALESDPDFLLARIALLRAHLELGDLKRAEEQARIALEPGVESEDDPLPRATRLKLEALAAESRQNWEEALSKWRLLWGFFPDEIEYGLGVARAQLESSGGHEALTQVEDLRKLADTDLRVDLVEARAAGQLGKYERQLDAALRARAKAEKLDSPLLRAQAHLQESAALRFTKSVADAIERARDAQLLFEEVGHLSGVAGALLEESDGLRASDRFAEAVRCARKAREIYEALGHRRGVADANRKLASSRLSEEPTEARKLYEEAQEGYEGIGNKKDAASMAHNIGLTYLREEKYERALELYEQSLKTFQSLGDHVGESLALNSLGYYHYHVRNDLDAAILALQQSARIKELINDRLRGIPTLMNLGQIHVRKGNLKKAEKSYTQALAWAQEMERPSHVATARFGLGKVWFYQDRLGDAERALMQALETHLEQESDLVSYDRWYLARVYLAQGKWTEVAEVIESFHKSPVSIDQKRGYYLATQSYIHQGKVPEGRNQLRRVEIEGDNEFWIELRILRSLLEAHLAQIEGNHPRALEIASGAQEQAKLESFKALELKARFFLCTLRSDLEEGIPCLDEARQEAKRSGFELFVRLIGERRVFSVS